MVVEGEEFSGSSGSLPDALRDEQEQTETQHDECAGTGPRDGTCAVLPELLAAHMGKSHETIRRDRRPHPDDCHQHPRQIHCIPVGRTLMPPYPRSDTPSRNALKADSCVRLRRYDEIHS